MHVYFEEDVWKIKSEGAKQASDSFDKKEDAMKRARNIADNRQTEIIEHKKMNNMNLYCKIMFHFTR